MTEDLRIIGMADQNQAYVASKNKSFRIGEFLIIEDRNKNGDIIAEVVEAGTYNRYIPYAPDGEFMDEELKKTLDHIGFDIDEGTVYLGKLHPVEEPGYPVETGSSCRIPKFTEIKPYFLTQKKEKGLVIGAIRNTDTIYKTIPPEDDDLKDLFYTLEKDELIKQREIPYIMDLYGQSQYPHIGIFGGSGSGKSYGLRVLLEEIMKKRIPGIVLDPHYEMDFSEKMREDYGPDYRDAFMKFTIGKDVGVDFTDLNKGELKTLLSAISPLSEAMTAAVDVLHESKDSYFTFSDRLDKLITGFKYEKPDRIRARMEQAEDAGAREELQKVLEIFMKYNTRVNGQSVTAIKWRLESLFRQGIFEKNIETLERALMDRKLAVVQGSVKMMGIFSSYLLRRIYKKRREYRDSLSTGEKKDYFPPFFIITDEAHNFAPQSAELNVPTRSGFREIAQEGRKYGVFLILATQRPALLDSTVTAQLNTKMIFRTTRSTDIDTIREETDLRPEETKRLPYLKTGDVFLSESALGRTIYVRIRAAHTLTPHKENPFDELARFTEETGEKEFRILKKYLPVTSDSLQETAALIEEKENITIGVDALEEKLKSLERRGYLTKTENFLGFDRYEMRSDNEI